MLLVYVRVDVKHLAQRGQNLMVDDFKEYETTQSEKGTSVSYQKWEVKRIIDSSSDRTYDLEGRGRTQGTENRKKLTSEGKHLT